MNFWRFFILLYACSAFSAPVFADEAANQRVFFGGDFRTQFFDDNNADLGSHGARNAAALSQEAKFHLAFDLSPNSSFYWEGRGVGKIGNGGFESSDTGSISRGKNFLEWRQSYFQFKNLTALPLTLTLGRQRVEEPQGLWWNEDFDAARISYDSTLFKGFALAGQNLFSYDTSQNFKKNDQKIAHFLAEGSWQYHYQRFFETRFAYQNDYSGIGRIGAVESEDNRNDSDAKLFWAGARLAGKAPIFAGADKTDYRFDLMGVAGHENTDITAPTGNGDQLVTGAKDYNVRGWAFDGAVDAPLPMKYKASLHLGYAYGSGDSNSSDDEDHAFRQTGLNGNYGRLGFLSQNADFYGIVLRPELSNLHIISTGLTAPVFKAADVGLIYRYYRLADAAGGLRASGVDNALNGRSAFLGQELDFLLNVDLAREFGVSVPHMQSVVLRNAIGVFRAGDAYGSDEGQMALRAVMELRLGF